MKFKQLILITGVERSGSTLISRVLQLCKANAGYTNKMRENVALRSLSKRTVEKHSIDCFMPEHSALESIEGWKNKVFRSLLHQNIPPSMPFIYKDSQITQLWSLWHESYPDAKWIIVRRRTGDILNSLHETSYMNRFKRQDNIKLVGAKDEKEAWLWWVHEYEDRFRAMIDSGINHRIVWPERMRDGDFEQMKEVVEWCNLEWNEEVVEVMQTLLNKHNGSKSNRK